MTQVNIPLFRKIVEWVEAQEQLSLSERHWFQGTWFRKDPELAAQTAINDPYCGTAMCVAGKIAYDAGWEPVFEDSLGDLLFADDATKDGVTLAIDEIAAAELGIDADLAEVLFSAENRAADIRRIAEDIAGERL